LPRFPPLRLQLVGIVAEFERVVHGTAIADLGLPQVRNRRAELVDFPRPDVGDVADELAYDDLVIRDVEVFVEQ
jgi:hypothetical protein